MDGRRDDPARDGRSALALTLPPVSDVHGPGRGVLEGPHGHSAYGRPKGVVGETRRGTNISALGTDDRGRVPPHDTQEALHAIPGRGRSTLRSRHTGSTTRDPRSRHTGSTTRDPRPRHTGSATHDPRPGTVDPPATIHRRDSRGSPPTKPAAGTTLTNVVPLTGHGGRSQNKGSTQRATI